MSALNGTLGLTEAQRQQQQAIVQRQFVATKAQREELFQLREKRLAGNLSPEDQARARTLHQEIRNAMTGVRGEMIGILTPEQRSQLETQRKQRNQERLNRRQKALINKPASAPPE
jgi:Spy/CpxP family protein refolding chaperone